MFLKFVLRNALRHRLRTALTALGIFVAILAFGLLSTVIDAWYSGANTASSSRLVTRSAVSLVFPLPTTYREKLRQIDGVSGVAGGQLVRRRLHQFEELLSAVRRGSRALLRPVSGVS